MSELLLGSLVFLLVVLLLTAVVLAARAWLLPTAEHTIVVNGRTTLTAQSLQKLLPVLADAGIAIPSTCAGAGTCGLCRVEVTRGGGEPTPTELARLDRAAVRAGTRLACQVIVRGDLEVELPDELFGVQRWTCTLLRSRTLTPFIAELVLELPSGASFEFRAGAFVQVAVPPYSLELADVEVAPEHRALWVELGKALGTGVYQAITAQEACTGFDASTNQLINMARKG
jgi:Na+-transporting NADH:ubiquinone oxidoreductase subunit F